MKVAIMQPYFLPYIGYWQLINIVDKYVILDDVTYIKGGWINRNNILLNNQKHLFTVLLSGASSYRLINEINLMPNQAKLMKKLDAAYRKAPYFYEVFELITKIFNYNDKNLAKFVGNSIMLISDYINIKTEFIYSSYLEKDNSLKGQERVLNICNILNATEYINAIGGKSLYNKEKFKANNINLFFINTFPINYKQFNNQFIPNLSIVDVLMFNPVKTIRNMLDNYELC